MIIHIFVSDRLLPNFEYSKGGLRAVKEILSEADKVKDGIYCPANPRLFGNLIKQLLREKVRLIKRGSKTRRQNFYLDLKLKSPIAEKIDTNNLAEEIPPLKSGWHLVVDDW